MRQPLVKALLFELSESFESSSKIHCVDLPPKKESSYNVSLEGQKGGTNGQKKLNAERIINKLREAEAIALKQRLGSIFPEQRIYIEQIGAALGAHSGPGAIFTALRRDK